MKTTEHFKNAIEFGLRRMAFTDFQLAEALKKPNKNIEECCDYILNQVKDSGASGYADEEVFSMAKHYFYEDDVEAKPFTSNYEVLTNQVAKLTDDEIKELKEKARQKVIDQEMAKMRKKPEKKTPEEKKDKPKETGTLF